MVYSDGSGGRFSDDPRRRRCGSAICSLRWSQGECIVQAAVSRPLLGARQIAPRSEIQAFCLALEEVPGSFLFITGHLSVA
eukprot:4762873-Pyramimonas_sp.AAC.1